MNEEKRPKRRVTDLKPVQIRTEVSDGAIKTAEDLRSQLRVLIALTIILYVVMGFLVWWIWSQQTTNSGALCAIRREAQARVKEGQEFLTQHPYGAYGLSRAQIQQSITDSIDTVSALQNLGRC